MKIEFNKTRLNKNGSDPLFSSKAVRHLPQSSELRQPIKGADPAGAASVRGVVCRRRRKRRRAGLGSEEAGEPPSGEGESR